MNLTKCRLRIGWILDHVGGTNHIEEVIFKLCPWQHVVLYQKAETLRLPVAGREAAADPVVVVAGDEPADTPRQSQSEQ